MPLLRLLDSVGSHHRACLQSRIFIATRSGSSSAESARRCRPCSTSQEDIKVVVDMTASV
jgi:hypothetical protein